MKASMFLKSVLAFFLISVVLGSSTLMPISAADKSAVEDFVTRFYRLCLSRDADPDGLNGWVSALLKGDLTGSDVANGFVFSKEFTDKNTTDDEYLEVLYEAFFNRPPDATGKQAWLDAIASGSSREDVLNGFIFAEEFKQLCDSYGIKAFEGHVTESNKASVEAFVTRFYQLCLGRNPDTKGLDGWTRNLLDQTQTGADVAQGFIGSQEFIDKDTSNEEYLTILYEAFFNRDPDPTGFNLWMEILNAGIQSSFAMQTLNTGNARDQVLNGFLSSQEFIELCEEYGILPFRADDNSDNDADGYTVSQGDCNDNDPTIYPGAPEICGDGIDQNCDGRDARCTSCTDIAGEWYVNETVSLSCCEDGNCETESFRSEGKVSIEQNGCLISYDMNVTRYGIFKRTGVVDGNEIRLTGMSMVHPAGCTGAQLDIEIGGIINFPKMNLQGPGTINRICSDDSYACTINYTATLNKTYPYLTMLSIKGQDCNQ